MSGGAATHPVATIVKLLLLTERRVQQLTREGVLSGEAGLRRQYGTATQFNEADAERVAEPNLAGMVETSATDEDAAIHQKRPSHPLCIRRQPLAAYW
ncbi:hypothetical protein NGM99_20710 [Mesorhizobium sp. RP14(2022)]|uniref:Uncharacterized protein n=1 Tax=Mesorhizobium liriopis TaxID=2953882 RepID=A0ABT1CBZ7_9HYPH|nr:hypothetical protein [Mesorhizobium liriopis]MCO6052213.1 hypothetical protein [Mesorhizobium liriopis]